MKTRIVSSTAYIAYQEGIYLKDLMIVIDDPLVFNALPGQFERRGVKTLTSWPLFVTVVLNNQEVPIEKPDRAIRSVCEVASNPYQLAFMDGTSEKPRGEKAKKRRVERALAEIRRLHDELNAALYSSPTERPSIHSPRDAYEILLPFMAHLDHEEMWVINLDTRNRVMGLVALYRGSVNSSQVRVAEVFRQAILDNAPAIIVAHNHPSSDPSPSPDDVAVTRAMVQAGKLLDVAVLDHVVVCMSSFVSLKERGLGFG